MSGRKVRSISFLVFVLLLASSFIGCGDQGSSPSTTPTPPPSGSWRGTQQFGSNLDDIGRAVTVDSSGNIYITGSTGGNLGTISFGGLDVFLAKFDPTGNLLFIQQFGSSRDDIGYGLAIDSSGNIFIVGSTAGSMPGNISFGGVDFFLAKFDSSGTLLFIQQFGSNLDDIGRGLAFDSSGNVLITGSTGGSMPGNTSFGGLDVFLAKFSSSGILLFIGQFGSNLDDIGYGIAVDSSGNVLMTGAAGGSMPGNTSFGGVDVFLARSDTSGVLRIQQFGSNLDDIGYGLAIDSSASVFITGSTGGILGVNSKGQLDAFLVKFNSAGVKQ